MKIKSSGNKGFTLVEMAMVMIIFGLIMSTVLLVFKIYHQSSNTTATRQAMEEIKSAVSDFRSVRGRFPCPARLEAEPGDADYGREDCIGSRIIISLGRDADKDGNDDEIMVGGVPFATILDPDPSIGVPTTDFSEADGFDAWGRKFTYGVSSLMTDTTTFNEHYGAIDILDEHGQTVLETEKTAHTVLISHGQNGIGAYTTEGKETENCALGVTIDADNDGNPDPPPGANQSKPDETENCDLNDAKFLSGLANERPSSFNDDFITYQIIQTSSIWMPTGLIMDDNGTSDPNDDTEIMQITNTNPGNIGLGTESPTDALEVVGDIQAMQILADQYCDGNGEDCLDPEVIAGTGMNCPTGQVVTSIEKNKVNCTPIFSGPVVGSCPTGKYMVGISNVTGVICQTL